MARLEKLSDGRYKLDFRVNKQRKRLIFENKKDAEEKKREVENLKKVSKLKPLANQLGLKELTPKPLREAIKFYCDTVTKVDKSEKSQKNERKWFLDFEAYLSQKHVKQTTDVRLEHLKSYKAHLQLSVSPKTKQPYHVNSIKRIFNSIRAMFTDWTDHGWMAENYCEKMSLVTVEGKKAKPWTAEEFDEVYSVASPWLKDILVFLKFTASRPIGASRLKWEDVDFVSQLAMVTTCKNSAGVPVKYPVALTSSVAAMLQARMFQARRQGTYSLDGYVFLRVDGNPVKANHICHQIRRIAEQIGKDELSAYGLRHAFAKSLQQAGVVHDTIRKQMGHSNIRTTQGYFQTDHSSVIESVEAVLEKKKGGIR